MVLGDAMHSGQGQRSIKGDETSATARRQCEQVGVGDLTRTVQMGPIDDLRVQQTDIAGPELVASGCARSAEQIDRYRRRDLTRVTRLADDPYETVLGDRARGPSGPDLIIEPVVGAGMIDMVAVEQG